MDESASYTIEKVVTEWEMISIFLAAFLGFLSALAVEFIVQWRSDRVMRKEMTTQLINELEGIKNDLVELKDDVDSAYTRYQYEVWKTCVNSGYLFTVSGRGIYYRFIEAYSDIEFADTLEQAYFELRVAFNLSTSCLERADQVDNTGIQQDMKELDKNRKDQRRKVISEIDRIITESTKK